WRRLRWCCHSLAVASFRRRNADTQATNHFSSQINHGGKQDDDLVLPTADVVAKRTPQSAVVGLVENKAALIVGEPNDKLLLLLTSRADRFHGHTLDPKLFLSFHVFSAEVL